MKGLKKYIRRERRSSPRHTVCTEVEFYAWDEVKKKPRTDKAQGCITEVSLKGACLQTNHLQMGDYHLFLDHDPKGKTVLAVEVPSRVEKIPVRCSPPIRESLDNRPEKPRTADQISNFPVRG
jgi:hypothetical protein